MHKLEIPVLCTPCGVHTVLPSGPSRGERDKKPRKFFRFPFSMAETPSSANFQTFSTLFEYSLHCTGYIHGLKTWLVIHM